MDQTYYFLFGNHPSISYLELKSVLDVLELDFKPHLIGNIAIIESAEKISIALLMSRLGGTVKIAQKIKTTTHQDLDDDILNYLKVQKPKITFAISDLSGVIGASSTQIKIKNQLNQIGIPSRFLNLRSIYSSAFQYGKNYHEIMILEDKKKLIIANVIAFQDITDWNLRDYSRPKPSPKNGMLPPKLARMMVNISLSKGGNGKLYDPFCGSGTVLAEAMMLGLNVYGSDIDNKKIISTKENLDWLKNHYKLYSEYFLFTSDVTQIKKDVIESVSSVVFEPYMGPIILDKSKITDLAKGLEKLYIGSIKKLHSILSDKGKMVFVLPVFKLEGKEIRTDKFIDRCENLGYTLLEEPLIYSRPQSQIKRAIYVLEKGVKYVKSKTIRENSPRDN